MRQNLKPVFKKVLKLYAKGNKLRDEGDNLRAEGNKSWDEVHKLHDEGDKFWDEVHKLFDEGYKLVAEGNKLWQDAVYKEYGSNAKIDWLKDYKCQVNGDIYGVYDGNDILKDLCEKT